MLSVSVEGASRLSVALRRAGADLNDLKQLNREAATIAEQYAKPLVPRKTGKLASSLRVGATNRAGIVRIGRASIPYAQPVHWGWPKRSIKPNRFLMIAASATEPEWTANYFDGLEKILDNIPSES